MNQSAISAIKNCPKSITSVKERDFFGIANITSKHIAGTNSRNVKLPKDKIASKYQELLASRNKLMNEEKDVNVIYGNVRFDRDNKTLIHGQFEPTSERICFDTIQIKQKFISPQDEKASQIKESEMNYTDSIRLDDVEVLEKQPPGYKPPYKLADIEPDMDLSQVLRYFNDPLNCEKIGRYSNVAPAKFFFDRAQSDQESPKTAKTSTNSNVEPISNDFGMEKLSGRQLNNPSDLDETIEEAIELVDSKPPLIYDFEKDKLPIEEMDANSENYAERIDEEMKKLEWDKSIDEELDAKRRNKFNGYKNALDYLKAIRAKVIEPTAKGLKHRIEAYDPYGFRSTVKLDSKGFNTYEYQVPDWSKFLKRDIINHLKRTIIYNNHGVLAINKPYGLASHEEVKGHKTLDIDSLMQVLAKELNYDQLFLAHRLDKTTTGVLIFATNQETARKLNKLFRSDQIQKTYWCITKGIPNPPHGIIDIPIGFNNVSGKARSCLCPENIDDRCQLSDNFREARRAVTEYRVLNSTKFLSLVEAKPKSGVKHQIRCHLGFGLGNAILGDHKYSHLDKLAPQTLPVQVLNLLRLRKEKTRTLPIHLHSKSAVIPGIKPSGDNLHISACLPAHFSQNMKTLGLKRSG